MTYFNFMRLELFETSKLIMRLELFQTSKQLKIHYRAITRSIH